MSHTTYKTRSNTLLLRRLITNLKDKGSDVAGELEEKAHDILSDVHIKKKKTQMVKLIYFTQFINIFLRRSLRVMRIPAVIGKMLLRSQM